MEYLGTALVAFILGATTGRLWTTVAIVAALWLLGWVLVVNGEPDPTDALGTTIALSALVVVVFSLVAGVGAWAGVVLRQRVRQH